MMNYSMGYGINNYPPTSLGQKSYYFDSRSHTPPEAPHYDRHHHCQESIWPLRCNNCANFAEIFCPRCENVGYCSEAHLLEDEMSHKSQCFPEQNFTEINRLPDSHEVTGISCSNNLTPGQTVAKIRPLMMAPHNNHFCGPPNSSLCFGCCKWFPTDSFECSLCGWPVCSSHCENTSLHSTYECEILHARNVSFSPFPGVYDTILALRCILMLEKSTDDEPISQAFRDWSSYKASMENNNNNNQNPDLEHFDNVAEDFLIKIGRLKLNIARRSSAEFIKKVLQFTMCNSMCQENRVSVYDSNRIRNYYSAKYVIPHKFAYGQSCIPNINWSMNYAPVLRENSLHLYTTTSIKIGDKLTVCFDQHGFEHLGTHERRALQMLHFRRKCYCRRCKDPTECGSYASALQCRNCMSGSVLSLNPLDEASPWKCHQETCGQEFKPDSVFKRFYQYSEEIDEDAHNIQSLMLLIKSMKHSLHQKHYLIAKAADRVVDIGWSDIRSKSLESLDSYFLKPLYKAARICLNFADAVTPGLTALRAKYIFMLQMIHGISATHDAVYHFGKNEFVEGQHVRQKFEDIYLHQVEFVKIAQFEKPGSCLHDWMQIIGKAKDDLGELLRTTAQRRAFDGYELERLKRAFSYFTAKEYEPNLPQDLHVDVSHIVFYIEPLPFRTEYKTFFKV